MSPKFKNSMRIFWHATMRGCTLAIAILVLFFTIMSIATSITGKSEQSMTFSSMMTLTAFSLVISYAKEIFKANTLPTPAQWAINFLIIGVAYFFVILRSGMLAPNGGSFYITGIVVYILLYLIVFGVTLLVKHLVSKNAPQEDAEEYTSRFV